MTEKMIAKTIEMTDEAINGMVASGADLVETGIDAVKEATIKKQEAEAEIFETATETIANVAENVLDAAQTSQEDIDLLKAYKNSKVLDAWIETIKNDETMSSQEKIDAYKEVREEERQAEASASQEQDKKCRRITKVIWALRKILCKKKTNQTMPVNRADGEILLLIASFPEWKHGMRASA